MRSLEERFGKWYNFLKPELESKYFKLIGAKVNLRRKVSKVYPESENVFKCFEITNISDINCIIVGQDPYPGYSLLLDKPVADGLAFSTSDEDKTPVSLNKIHKAIEDDCYGGFNLDAKNDLSYLSEQGVLLLNRTMTVEHNAPLSHVDIGWDEFTGRVIKLICSQDRPIAIITFGKGPKELVDKCLLNTSYHQIINVEHPAYAGRQGRELDHKNCFTKTNEFIEKHYGKMCRIKW
jgi:uracil-DNA glycosylase